MQETIYGRYGADLITPAARKRLIDETPAVGGLDWEQSEEGKDALLRATDFAAGVKDGLIRANRIHWDEFRCLGPSLTTKASLEERERAERFFEEMKSRRSAYYTAGFRMAFELAMHEVEGSPEFLAQWWVEVGQFEETETGGSTAEVESELEIPF